MKKIKFCFTFFYCFAVIITLAQTPFTSGNIVVARLGNGSVPISNVGTPGFLDEYTPGGVLVQSIALPTTQNGANKSIVFPTNNPWYGELTTSGNGQFLCMFGYNGALGTPIGAFDETTEKTIARIDYNGSINSSTVLFDENAYGIAITAITNNGTDFWCLDNLAGIYYGTLGSITSSNILTSGSGGIRAFNITNGQLYAGGGANTIHKIGSGLPTSSASLSLLPGIAGNPNNNSNCFFVDLNPGISGSDVLYIAADGSNALQKYSFDGTNWILNGSIGVDADNYRSVTGVKNGTTVTLYCTRKTGTGAAGGGELVTLTDASGYNGAFTGSPLLLATAGNQTSFRGIAMAPLPPSVSLSTKAFLQGAYSAGLGRHKDMTASWAAVLNASALNQPYNVAPYNYGGTESVSAGFFTSTGGTADIVDWVLLELHDATTPSTIIARQAAFIREDGKVVGLDGVSDPSFTGVGANNYYIVLRDRNHLSIRSSSTVFVNGATPVLYDFTTAQSKAYQNGAITTNAAMKDVSGVFVMWSGNANMNTNVRYTGLNNDAAALLAALSGNQAAVLNNVFHPADINLDGVVRYTGLNNDAAALLSSLGGNQAAVLTEHQ